MTSLHTLGDGCDNEGGDDKEAELDHETDEETTVTSTTNCQDDKNDAETDELRRLHSLIAQHKSRSDKLETENATLRLDLANVKFDLEHCRLELRQMTTRRDALQKEVTDALNSKATLAQNLGRENFEMLSTIDKLETERDVLLEELEKLRAWITKNKGEGDDDVIEEGKWVATEKNNVFRSPDQKTKSNITEESTSSPLTAANTFDSSEGNLYSEEYLSLAYDDSVVNDDEDDESFQKSFNVPCTTDGRDDSTIGSVNTNGSKEAEKAKRTKKKRWGVSVRPRTRKNGFG